MIQNGSEVSKEVGKSIVEGAKKSPFMKSIKGVGLISDLYDAFGAVSDAYEKPTVGNITKAVGKTAWLMVSNFTPVGRTAAAIIDVGSGIMDLFDGW